jgi:hypothetical protein
VATHGVGLHRAGLGDGRHRRSRRAEVGAPGPAVRAEMRVRRMVVVRRRVAMSA